MTTEQLKPCPFCGSDQIVTEHVRGGAFSVKCCNLPCDASFLIPAHGIETGAQKWNRRETETELLAALKLLLHKSGGLDLSATSYGLENCQALAQARAAILKAEGKQP